MMADKFVIPYKTQSIDQAFLATCKEMRGNKEKENTDLFS